MEMLAWDSGQNPVPCGNNPYSEYMHYSLYIYIMFFISDSWCRITHAHILPSRMYIQVVSVTLVFFSHVYSVWTISNDWKIPYAQMKP